jgi:hypothetical protein
MLLAAKEDEARGLRGSEVKPFTTEVCYQRALGDLKTFVGTVDTTVPDTGSFWPTLADGWDAGATCRAYEKLENGVEAIDSWLVEVDARIAALDGYAAGLDRLSRASTKLGQAMLDAAEKVQTHGSFGGLIAWYSVTELTGYGLYFSREIHADISVTDTVVATKAKEARAAKSKLEEERGKLRESADVLKLQHGAANCSRHMENLVAEKQKADRLTIMDMAVEAKLKADSGYQEGGSGAGSSDVLGEFLGGVLQGLAGAGSVGVPGGGTSNANCAQVRAEIQSNRNWLAQAGAPATSQHRAAIDAVRRRHDQNVAWYNRNCN